jgi:hypothetical protein
MQDARDKSREEGSDATPGWAAALIAGLETQRALADELAPLAERQGDLIRDGQSDALLGLLARRQEIIDRFLGEAERLSAEVGDARQLVARLPEEPRGRVRELIEQIDARLAHVLSLDERDQSAMQTARDETRRQLTSLDAGRTARQAYTQRQGASRFADRRG